MHFCSNFGITLESLVFEFIKRFEILLQIFKNNVNVFVQSESQSDTLLQVKGRYRIISDTEPTWFLENSNIKKSYWQMIGG